jgi:mRNA-degrading endonuclease toxin of MazEF toxin-antitoxin module
VRHNRWELSVSKPFLKPGVFHLQQIQAIPLVRLERKLGDLTAIELQNVRMALTKEFKLA